MTDHGCKKHLIPVGGDGPRLDAVFTPLTDLSDKKGTRFRRASSHIVTFFCAMACLLCITIVFLISASFLHRADLAQILPAFAEQALLRCVHISLTAPSVTEDFPLHDSTAVSALPQELTDVSKKTEENPKQDAETEASFPIRSEDLSCQTNIFTLLNETIYTPDTDALYEDALPFPGYDDFVRKYGEEAPYILILHTHGTEAYAPAGRDTYTKSDSFRSQDVTENVVAVGEAMADVFRTVGIGVLHCEEMFDTPSYQNSYSRAAAAIQEYLAEYPSIQIVLDVHRDSIIRSDYTKIRPLTEVNGLATAQCMIVVGTDYKGANHPNWQNNLNFALKIQGKLQMQYSSLMRSINLRGAGFNEQFTAGSLLLEIGSCGNTLEEAKRAGTLLALSLADVVCGGDCGITPEDICP